MESNHCFYCPHSLLLPLQPSGHAVCTLHASRPSWCNLLYSMESEDIRKAITINIRLYSSLWLCVYQSFSDSLTVLTSYSTPPPPLLFIIYPHILCHVEDLNGLTAGTHAAPIKDGYSESETQERWSRGEDRGRWSEGSCS